MSDVIVVLSRRTGGGGTILVINGNIMNLPPPRLPNTIP